MLVLIARCEFGVQLATRVRLRQARVLDLLILEFHNVEENRFLCPRGRKVEVGSCDSQKPEPGIYDVREKVDSLNLSPVGCVLIVKIVCCSPVEAYAFTLPIPH